MTTLYITEFSDLGQSSLQAFSQTAAQPEVASQTRSLSNASAQSSALNANTRFVRLHTDTACYVKFGTNPTATSSNGRMAANTTEYFSVPVNSAYKVAAITD